MLSRGARARASLLSITGLFLDTNGLLLLLGTDGLLFLGTGFLFSFLAGERGVERGDCFGGGGVMEPQQATLMKR